MKLAAGLVSVIILLHGPIFAQTIYDSRGRFETLGAYREFLDQTRLKLYGDDEDDREELLEMLQTSALKPVSNGDEYFPLRVMADFVMGIGLPESGEADEEYQEETIEFIIDLVNDDDYGSGPRESAVGALIRIISAEQIGEFEWNEWAVDALIDQSGSDDHLVAHAAIVGLGHAAGKTLADWEDLSLEAAEALADRMDGGNIHMNRLAIRRVIRTLSTAEESTAAVDYLWQELADILEDVESPALKRELDAPTKALFVKHGDGIFEDEVDALKDAWKEMNARRRLASTPLDVSLGRLRGSTDALEVEALLAKIEKEALANRGLLLATGGALAAIAADPEIPAAKLHHIVVALTQLAYRAPSSLVYFRVASMLTELAAAHRGSPRGAIPIAQLGRLLAATDQPFLKYPVIDEVRVLAGSGLPHWMRRRLTALLFMQAGDAIDGGTRQRAFDGLSAVGKRGNDWSMRQEVSRRMTQLAELAQHPEIQSGAAAWN